MQWLDGRKRQHYRLSCQFLCKILKDSFQTDITCLNKIYFMSVQFYMLPVKWEPHEENWVAADKWRSHAFFWEWPRDPSLPKRATSVTIRSDQISHSVVSDSLRPHESRPARPPCPSPTPGVHWDSLPSSQWCHPAISSSVVPFSSCPQSLPASGSFPMNQLFAWGHLN